MLVLIFRDFFFLVPFLPRIVRYHGHFMFTVVQLMWQSAKIEANEGLNCLRQLLRSTFLFCFATKLTFTRTNLTIVFWWLEKKQTNKLTFIVVSDSGR